MNIDNIFIINLKYRTDRRAQIIEEMQKQNIINYEFFDAICPSITEVKNWNPNFCNHIKTFIHPSKFNNYQIGCLGCLKSHTEVCKIALKRQYKNILILEDDTEFIQDFNKLYEYSNQIQNNYDMLYLTGSHLGTKQEITTNIIKINGTHTTGSYLITEKAMKYFVNNIDAYSKEIDVFFAKDLQEKFDCYCIIPHITKQRDGYSDIQQINVSYKLS